MSHDYCGPIAEAIAQAKHQEAIEAARIERIVQEIRKAQPSNRIKIVYAVRQAIRQIGRVVNWVVIKLQEQQKPIL